MLIVICLFIMVILLIFSDSCSKGAIRGIIISGKIIIPSLFPFSVMVLMIIRSDIKLFPDTEFAFILSVIGGYPVGAQLVEEIYNKGRITKKGANLMRGYCVNAGPAFIITAIGTNLLHSKHLGIILLTSHILSSLSIKIFLSRKLKKEIAKKNNGENKNFDLNSLFCNSVKDAATSTISICSFIILFSVINSILSQFKRLKAVTYFFEVTTAVTEIKNIYAISFLLGFAGISIWAQIFSLSTKSGISYVHFIISRITHGFLSVFYTHLQILIFKPVLYTASYNLENTFFISKPEIAISIILFVVVLILSLENKNNSRKKLWDLLK